MEVKSPAYPDVGLAGFGHLDLPLRFCKSQPGHLLDVLIQKGSKSFQRSGETSMGFLIFSRSFRLGIARSLTDQTDPTAVQFFLESPFS